MGLFDWLKKEKAQKKERYSFDEDDRENAKKIKEAKRDLEILKMEKDAELYKLKMERDTWNLKNDIRKIREEFDLGEGDEEDYYEQPDDEDNFQKILAQYLPLIMKPQANNSAPPIQNPAPLSTTPPNAAQVSVSDADLLALYNKVPDAAKAYARTIPDETLASQIKIQMPNWDDETLKRCVAFIREKEKGL